MSVSKNRFRENVPYPFKYSKPVDPAIYEDNPEYFCNIRPRISVFSDYADDACWEAREEYFSIAGAAMPSAVALMPKGVGSWGCIDTVSGNATAQWMPELQKEHLKAFAWFTEIFALHDDYLDTNEYAQETENESSQSNLAEQEKNSMKAMHAMQVLFAHALVLFLSAGEKSGKLICTEMEKFQHIGGDKMPSSFNSLDEYLMARETEVGISAWETIMCYGIPDPISAEVREETRIREAIHLAWFLIMLYNDYWSWDKELEAMKGQQKDEYPANAVHVLMSIRGIDDANTAKAALKADILARQDQYDKVLEGLLADLPSDSPHVRVFGLLDMFIAGNALWSMTTPRYHKDAPRPRVRVDSAISIQETPRVQQNGAHQNGVTPPSTPGAEKILDTKVVLEPYKYVASLSGKSFRDQLLGALNTWYNIPADKYNSILEIITILNNVSLILDDIEDRTPLRRGSPSTHRIFGEPQTFNSVNYMYVECFEKFLALPNNSVSICIEELKTLHIGQQSDLHWTYHCSPPTEQEYFEHAEQKTGALFRLAARLMQNVCRTIEDSSINSKIYNFMMLLGRHYQVRDDYLDLLTGSGEASCDLDQGNYSLPIIHTISQQHKKGKSQMRSVLQARKLTNSMTPDMKELTLGMLKEEGSLTYARDVLNEEIAELNSQLEQIEVATGQKNWIMRLALFKLKLE